MNAYRWIVGFGLPFAVLLISTLGKKIARGPGWAAVDFYVVDQLSLAAMADAASSIIAAHKPGSPGQSAGLIWGNLGILFLGIILFFLRQSLWQDYGPGNNAYRAKAFVRIITALNFVGFLALAGASLLLAA